MIYVSGAERPPELRALGPTSNLPEEFGVDFMWATPTGMVGFQRKAFPGDLLASLNDGRLGKELAQMKALTVAGLILEGRPMFSEWGDLLFSYGSMTQAQIVNLQYSLMVNHGLVLLWTETPAETAKTLQTLYAYSSIGKESSLMKRVDKSKWGKSDAQDFATFLVESVPGVGHDKARKIVRAYGGGLPVKWHGTREKLLEIDGIGPKTADSIIAAFGGLADA